MENNIKKIKIEFLNKKFPHYNNQYYSDEHPLYIGNDCDYNLYSLVVSKTNINRYSTKDLLEIFSEIKNIEEKYKEILDFFIDESEKADLIAVLLLGSNYELLKKDISFINKEMINSLSKSYRVSDLEITKSLIRIIIMKLLMNEETNFLDELKNLGDLNILLAKTKRNLINGFKDLKIKNVEDSFYLYKESILFLTK